MTGWQDFAVVMLSSAGVSVVLTPALVWLLHTWIGERVRGAIQAEYAEKLESLRAQLQADAALKLETYRATLKGQGDAELEKLRASLAIAEPGTTKLSNGSNSSESDAVEFASAGTRAELERRRRSSNPGGHRWNRRSNTALPPDRAARTIIQQGSPVPLRTA